MEPLDLVGRLAPDAPGGAVLLDGGTATELERDGHDLSDALWSARLLLDAPESVTAVHRRFLDAGAEVVTTASYQLAAASLAAAGRGREQADVLLARSVAVARAAVDAAVADGWTTRDGRRPLVAASIGPYGAVLADGSEYRGGYGLGEDELVAFHAPRVAALVDAGADVLAVETVPSALELAALARVLAGVAVPVYASVTLGPDGRTTAEGQPLASAFAPLLALDEVVAVGVNCCPPPLVLPALRALAHCSRPLVAKPNVGRRWDAAARRWVARDDAADTTGAPRRVDDDGAEHAVSDGAFGYGADRDGRDAPGDPSAPRHAADPAAWVAAGARLVGGCCGTGPQHLRRLAGRIDRR